MGTNTATALGNTLYKPSVPGKSIWLANSVSNGSLSSYVLGKSPLNSVETLEEMDSKGQVFGSSMSFH